MKKIEIIFPDGEGYIVNFDTALELTMKVLCHEYGWQMYYGSAQLKKRYLEVNPGAFLSEFNFVDVKDIAEHLEPKLLITDEDDLKQLQHDWRYAVKMFIADSGATNNDLNTLNTYGY